jgi:hypothetical protein
MKSALSGMHPFWAICVRSCRYGYCPHPLSLATIAQVLCTTFVAAQLRSYLLKINEVSAYTHGDSVLETYAHLSHVTSRVASREKRRRRLRSFLRGFYTRQIKTGLAELPADDECVAAI